MKISIIIPIYNVEKEISRCLLSIVNQDYEDIDLVLVNDATPDSSFKIAQLFFKENPFKGNIQFIEHEYNRGLSCARNTGIDLSTGDYLFFLDSDDILSSPTTISDLVTILNSLDSLPQIVVGGYRVHGLELRAYEEVHYKTNKDIYYAYLHSNIDVVACGKLISRRFLIDNNLYFEPGIYHEDNLWTFKWTRCAKDVYVISVPVFDYFYREGSITSAMTQKHLHDLVTIILLMYKEYKKKPQYFANETILLIAYLMREHLKGLYQFQDKKFVKREIKRLKQVHLPIFATGKYSLIRGAILMKMPSRFIYEYLRLKWSTSSHRHSTMK